MWYLGAIGRSRRMQSHPHCGISLGTIPPLGTFPGVGRTPFVVEGHGTEAQSTYTGAFFRQNEKQKAELFEITVRLFRGEGPAATLYAEELVLILWPFINQSCCCRFFFFFFKAF